MYIVVKGAYLKKIYGLFILFCVCCSLPNEKYEHEIQLNITAILSN